MQTNSETAHDRALSLLAEKQANLPIWIRPPKSGSDYWTGFCRSKLYQLARDGKIRSVSIRSPGQTKGVRLFELRSVLDFIERNAANAEEVANGAA
jgi:hypothetical protein